MKPETLEWIAKAEADFDYGAEGQRARSKSHYEIMCFHCQQSAEKYLKARLCEAGIQFPRTHDLELLINLALPVQPLWAAYAQAARTLSDFAVKYRYPGSNATSADARLALAGAKQFRQLVRSSLGLPVSPAKKKKASLKMPRRKARNKK